MKWKKLGRVFVANGRAPWARTHAFLPTPILRPDGNIRVYAAFLDRDRVGRVGYVDVDGKNPRQVLGVSTRPVLEIGEQGTFDDNGVNPVSIVDYGGKKYLYYVGWQLGVKVRYYLFTGAAVSEDGGETFTRCRKAPVLDRSDAELYLRSAANVHFDDGRWKMWYVAGSSWIEVNGRMVPSYKVRYLESPDGLTWAKEGRVCLGFGAADEFGFGRPYVIRRDGAYQMWYSIRTTTKGYRMGYAESPDGLDWDRKDAQVGIDVSLTGWDSQMICFGAIVQCAGGTFMFYNGNNYGATGFGVAVLE
jgi:hypothetical protein